MGNIYLEWLDDVVKQAAQETGYQWKVLDGSWLYRSRSSGGFDSNPLCIMWHHTAGSDNAQGDAEYQAYSADARPISNMTVDSKIAIIIAGGATNTNGSGKSMTFSRGTVASDDMNRRAIGIEICNNGVGAPYSEKQLNFLFRFSNLANNRCGNQPTDVCTHQHYAPDRKVDPATNTSCQGPWRPNSVNSSGSWNVTDLRNECKRRWSTPDPAPTPTPPEIPEGADMPLYAAKVEGQGWWLLTGTAGRKLSADDLDYVAKKMWSAKSQNPNVMQPLVDLNTGVNVRDRSDVTAVNMSSVKAFGGS